MNLKEKIKEFEKRLSQEDPEETVSLIKRQPAAWQKRKNQRAAQQKREKEQAEKIEVMSDALRLALMDSGLKLSIEYDCICGVRVNMFFDGAEHEAEGFEFTNF